MCTPWVTFFVIIAGLVLFWLSCLFICHIYQVRFFICLFFTKSSNNFIFKAVFIALTTNERMNMFRYKHFADEKGNFINPFK